MVLRNRGSAICPRLCPYELFSSPTPSSLGLQDLVSHGQEEGSPGLLVEIGAGPGLRWPTVLADVLFLLQRPPCWLPGPIHGTCSPLNQNRPDAAALSCCPKVFLGMRVSFVTSLSSLWGHCPLPLPSAHVPRLYLFLHCLPGKGLPQCTGQPVVREAALVSLLRGDATQPPSATAMYLLRVHTGDKSIPSLDHPASETSHTRTFFTQH